MTKGIRVLVVIFVVLQVLDSCLTSWAVRHGYVELNPLMVGIAHNWWMPTCKVLMAIAAGFLAVIIVDRFPETWRLARVAVVVTLLAGTVYLAVIVGYDIAQLLLTTPPGYGGIT